MLHLYNSWLYESNMRKDSYSEILREVFASVYPTVSFVCAPAIGFLFGGLFPIPEIANLSIFFGITILSTYFYQVVFGIKKKIKVEFRPYSSPRLCSGPRQYFTTHRCQVPNQMITVRRKIPVAMTAGTYKLQVRRGLRKGGGAVFVSFAPPPAHRKIQPEEWFQHFYSKFWGLAGKRGSPPRNGTLILSHTRLERSLSHILPF